MGFRFRKQIKIFPGVKINLTKNGWGSTTIGGRGAAWNIPGPECLGGRSGGQRITGGIPGTGLSCDHQFQRGGQQRQEEFYYDEPQVEEIFDDEPQAQPNVYAELIAEQEVIKQTDRYIAFKAKKPVVKAIAEAMGIDIEGFDKGEIISEINEAAIKGMKKDELKAIVTSIKGLDGEFCSTKSDYADEIIWNEKGIVIAPVAL